MIEGDATKSPPAQLRDHFTAKHALFVRLTRPRRHDFLGRRASATLDLRKLWSKREVHSQARSAGMIAEAKRSICSNRSGQRGTMNCKAR